MSDQPPTDSSSPGGVRTYVVVLNWNGWRDTLTCLDAIGHMAPAPDGVIVVDNGSEDDSVERIRRLFPRLTLLETGRNLGFAAGANVGIRHALASGGDQVWLLNNDTLPAPDALRALRARIEADPSVGIVGSTLRYAHNPALVQALGGGWLHWWLGLPVHINRPDRLDRLEYIIGASMLVRRQVFTDVGLFDERFFLYWEDADLCRRAVDKGWRLAVALDSEVLHKEGGTASGGARRVSATADIEHLRSLRRFMKKHHPFWPAPLLARGLLEVPNQIRYGTPSRLPSYFSALMKNGSDPH